MGTNRAGARRKQKLKETKRLAEQRARKKAAQTQGGDTGQPPSSSPQASPAEEK